MKESPRRHDIGFKFNWFGRFRIQGHVMPLLCHISVGGRYCWPTVGMFTISTASDLRQDNGAAIDENGDRAFRAECDRLATM